MKRVHLIISGDVIGVGYRSWVKRQARELGVSGWVKNREDNTVELVVEGSKDHLTAVVAICKKGPDVAWVKDVVETWQDATGEFVDFEVLY
jgi:acylphosphatase